MTGFLPYESSARLPFCMKCNTLLAIQGNGRGDCAGCGFQCDAADLVTLEVVTTSAKRPMQRWLKATDDGEERARKVGGPGHAEVDEECPKCSHPRASFYTMQLRSADEGATVFYECLSCGYKWRQNN
jgi:DNA-directed RNA polymerase I subunit RPA12